MVIRKVYLAYVSYLLSWPRGRARGPLQCDKRLLALSVEGHHQPVQCWPKAIHKLVSVLASLFLWVRLACHGAETGRGQECGLWKYFEIQSLEVLKAYISDWHAMQERNPTWNSFFSFKIKTVTIYSSVLLFSEWVLSWRVKVLLIDYCCYQTNTLLWNSFFNHKSTTFIIIIRVFMFLY